MLPTTDNHGSARVADARPAKRAVKVSKAPRAAARAAADGHGESRVVKADADKLFFIEMLVKDIELVPAVLDLVDNSVDGARAMALAAQMEDPEGEPPEAFGDLHYEGRTVSVTVGPEAFEIADNCGGIDLDTARDYAFRFGRSEEYEGVPGSVGEFGVGMKRALFKMGRAFTVTSRTETTYFALDVNVDEWADEPGAWTFRLDEAQKDLPPPGAEEIGTTIRVTRLHDTVAQDFADPLVVSLLKEQLRLRHQGAIQAQMSISLNGTRLTPFLPALLVGPMFKPVNRSFTLNQPAGPVFARIVAGIVPPPRQREIVDEGRAESFQDPGDAGWWVFCNDRLLLMRDRTAETGWGRGAAAYHPQYRLFRGYVYLTAANTALLPWNTTKTGVDQDSRVWRQVQTEMRSALVEVQSVINRLKNEREESDDATHAPVTNALAAAVSKPLKDLPLSNSAVVPPPPPRRPAQRRPDTKKIQYNVDIDRFNEVADELGTTNASEIGRQTFDYFYEREV